MQQSYDIIGDIHGHGDLLEKLLLKLGYDKLGDVFRHPKRKAVFCGDYIDRGQQNIKAIDIVKNMVENGEALAIPGNHDLAFVQYHTSLEGTEQNMIPKSFSYDRMFSNTMFEFEKAPDKMFEFIEWVKNLPLFIEEGFRVYHGCRSEHVKELLTKNGRVMSFGDTLADYQTYKAAVDLITKSASSKITFSFNGIKNKEKIRLKWWKQKPEIISHDQLLLHLRPALFDAEILEYEVDAYNNFYPYAENENPLFLGHFCFQSAHGIVQSNICITDLCVIGTGRLTAYRYDGESVLEEKKIWIVQ